VEVVGHHVDGLPHTGKVSLEDAPLLYEPAVGMDQLAAPSIDPVVFANRTEEREHPLGRCLRPVPEAPLDPQRLEATHR
jgi:hypothetical protein